MKHLLKLADLSGTEILEILDLADNLKTENKKGVKHRILAGKTLGMIFQKASTRTRVSFEVGMYQLGGAALFLTSNDLQIGRGEPICDTARVLSRYLDGVMIRTFKQSDVEDFARYGTIPVINGLTDYAHPCQVLADLMTVRERKGKLAGLKMAYVGDGNNMANSLIVGGLKVGMSVSVATPKGYKPANDVLNFAKDKDFVLTESVEDAVDGADAVFTDVWASMGQESEFGSRKVAFAGYCVDEELLRFAKPDALVLHCLPAHRGEEISAGVFETHAGEIFDEAENRLHAQKAVLAKLLT